MRGYRFKTRVDVIPVINVSLVVVLTLMIIAPHLNNTEKQVALPEASASEVDDTENVEITYTLDGEIFVGEEAVAFEDLRPVLASIFELNKDAVAVVKADEMILYGDVERLLAEVEAAKAPRVAIATRNRQVASEGSP